MGVKGVLTVFRSLVFMAIVVLLFSNARAHEVLGNSHVAMLLTVYFLSICGMGFLNAPIFENRNFLSGVFIVDTIFITAGMYVTGAGDADLFLIFFTTVFISALSQDVKSVFSVAIVSCALYAFLHLKSHGAILTSDTGVLVRFPFLFIAAALSGFLAMETKKHQEENRRLVGMNLTLANQADASTQKLFETNRKLKNLLEYHHCVLSSFKTGVIVARKDGTVRTFNAGARQITGQIEAEMAERHLEDLPENLSLVAAALKRTLREGKTFVQDHLEIKSTRSEKVPVTLETSLLKAGNGEVIGAIATIKDMTLLRQMETQLLRAERFSALGEMAAGVAHEIKNPLNAIMGFSKRLSAKVAEPSLKKYADIIAEEVVRMDSIVNDVLDYSRTDHVDKKSADLHRILDETVAFLDEKLEKACVHVQKDFQSRLPAVPMDVTKIRQVVLNLVLNAMQAMPAGGTIIVKTKLIEGLAPELIQGKGEGAVFQQLFLQQKMAAISVSDRGCGIAKENLSKLFHPFFTTKITGTGLGLSICHKIIASHGGALDVESEVGKGSTFTFYLPIED
jgi:PAS domain S-box-containing protein